MNVADVVIEKLGRWGVPFVTGIPGDSVDPLMEAIRRQKQVKFLQVRHEETGALIASAYAKLTGQLAACLGTAGPGAIHLLNGLYDARMDHAPVVALTGQVDSRLVGTDYFQEVDVLRLFSDVAVYNQAIHQGENAAVIADMACRMAVSRRSVSNITVPFNVGRTASSMDGRTATAYYKRAITVPIEEDISAAVQLLDEAERIAMLVGRGAWEGRGDLLALAEHLSAPVVNTLPAKGILPEDHPLSVGGLGMMGARPGHEAVERADLLLMVGTSYPYLEFLPKHTKTIQIDADAAQIGKRWKVDVGLAGDARVALQILRRRARAHPPGGYLRSLQEARKEWWRRREREAASEAQPIRPQAVVQAVQEAVRRDAVLSVDVGNVLFWMAHNFCIKDHIFLTSAWLGTMACGLPGAIAAKLAYPERQSVAVVGDGGFAMLMGDLVTAVKYELPIVVVILNNAKLAMIKFEQEVIGYPEYGVDLTNPDFARYAEAAGGHGLRVEHARDLPTALREAVTTAERTKRPALVDVIVNAHEVPVPPKISLGQAAHFAMAVFRETFD